jgi:hypothetical protein
MMADERPKRRLDSPDEGLTQRPGELSARFSEGALRRYLLGFYHPLLSEGIDLPIIAEGADPILDVVEDELIEEYVTGEMSDADRPLFESRFLFNEQRLEKIRLSAMLLGRPDVAEGVGRRAAEIVKTAGSELASAPNVGAVAPLSAGINPSGGSTAQTEVVLGAWRRRLNVGVLLGILLVTALIYFLRWFLQSR